HTIGILGMTVGGVLLILGIVRLGLGRRPVEAARPGAADRIVRGGLRGQVQHRVYRTSKGKIIAMVAVVVYILSPIDLVPDVFLPVGIIDDGTAFAWLLFAIGQEVSRKRRAKAARDSAA